MNEGTAVVLALLATAVVLLGLVRAGRVLRARGGRPATTDGGHPAPGSEPLRELRALVYVDDPRRAPVVVDEVVSILGPELRRLSLVTVADPGDPADAPVRRLWMVPAPSGPWRTDRLVLRGPAGDAVVDQARAGAYDLIALPSGDGPLRSTVTEVLDRSPVPVLLVTSVRRSTKSYRQAPPRPAVGARA